MKKLSSIFVKGISVLPALIIMPAVATDYTWWHPENIDSYTTVNTNISSTVGNDAEYNTITGTSLRDTINGNVSLTVNNVHQIGTDEINGVYGNAFFTSAQIGTLSGAVDPDAEKAILPQFINGNLSVNVINNSIVDRNVIGSLFYTNVASEIGDNNIGLSGKTTVNVTDSTILGDVRGANIGNNTASTDPKIANIKVNDIEININNSLIEDEVVAVGAYVSAGNVKINMTGNSSIGYDVDGNVVTGEDGWIVAGTQRSGGTVKSTEVNLNTNGADNEIKIAGDIHVGSREVSQNTEKDSSPNSVIGNATLNMFGGGTINVGGNLRAYHVGGNTELNINDVTANVAGNIANEFQTINMNENAILNANTLTMKSGDTMNMTLLTPDAYSQINVDTLDANGATLNMVVKNAGTYNVVNANHMASDFAWNTQNAVFDLVENNGAVTATVKSAESIVASNKGLSHESGQMISALATSDNAAANQMSLNIQTALANGDTDYVETEVSKMNPTKKPVAASIALGVQNQVLSAAGERMSLPLTGRSGGDVRADLGVWAKGTYNRTKHKDIFTGNTWGGSVGVDTDINHSVILGAGYAFGQTDLDMRTHNADIDSNTIFVYAQYRNMDWFINGTIAYTMAKYDWDKTVFGVRTDPSYHVNSLSEQVMGGYHFANGITPTLGLRYMDVHQDSYKDGLVTVNALDSTYVTGVAGMDFKNAWIAPNTSLFWNPELHMALTYDMVSDADTAIVMIPGAAAYTVDTESLSRLGGELGIGVTAEYYYLTVSLNYDVNIHKDFSSQTGSLKVKYKF